MRVVQARNVCDALMMGLNLLLAAGEREESRNGPVRVMPEPVTMVYERPWERVLTSPIRDANPFFHLVESLWMLSGRGDAGLLNRFVSDFGLRFAEEDGVVHGAYGHRWRVALGLDQLEAVVERLRGDPTSRQAVIQMWDAVPGGQGPLATRGSDDLRGSWRDRPCNTHVYLRVRRAGDRSFLDLTVCCRSNDIIMGAYGANAVHFSVLQEYLAARIGVGIGTMYQVSNNFHAYEGDLEVMARRSGSPDPTRTLAEVLYQPTYEGGRVAPLPMVTNAELFDEEVRMVLDAYEDLRGSGDGQFDHVVQNQVNNQFLSGTVWPMLRAHGLRRDSPRRAAAWAAAIEAPDWGQASREWLGRRGVPC